MAMESVYQNISNSPAQDVHPVVPVTNGQEMKTVLMGMILPAKADALDEICSKLERYLVSQPSGRYLMEFDVDPGNGGRPAKYSKQYVYNYLDEVVLLLEVNMTYFFWWVAEHTNLADKPTTVKTMHKRAYTPKA